MVVLGTRAEYFNAVWVKNEWSRYLALIKQGQKKMLIPAYKDMDPYDLPEEFSHLQAQDMSKLGFMQDLVRGIKKIAKAGEPKAPPVIKETVVSSTSTNISPLLKRAFMFLEDGEWDRADDFCEQVLNIDPECAQAYVGKLMAELKVKAQDSLKDCKVPFDGYNNYQKAIRFADEKLKNTLTGYIEHINTRNENARLDGIYTRAKNAMSEANTESAYKEAARIFETIREYKDAATLADECYEKAEVARKDHILFTGKSKMTGEVISNYETAIKLFESISGWKDADEKTNACQKMIETIKVKAEVTRKDAILAAGKTKMARDIISDYEAAIELFESISGWKDADEKICACRKKIEDLKAKAEADRLERERKAKKIKKIAIIAAPIVCVVIAFIIVLNIVLNIVIPNGKYNDAIALMDAGNIVGAYEALIALDGYKDSAEKASSIFGKYFAKKNENIKVGEYIIFGACEQDNNTSNGKEEIEWLVLKLKDGKALVISKYALDCKLYNDERVAVTWETCTLRKWLNNDFFDSAFSADEKTLIPTVTVSADKNPEYSTNPGNATQDQVFLLSITEAENYLYYRSAQCKPTDYAVANGAYVNSDNGKSPWWLRSPGCFQPLAAGVRTDGYVREGGFLVDDVSTAVRPALWIDLNS